MAVNYVQQITVGDVVVEVGKEYDYLDTVVEVLKINQYTNCRPGDEQVDIETRFGQRTTVDARMLDPRPTREQIQAAMARRPARKVAKPPKADLTPRALWKAQVEAHIAELRHAKGGCEHYGVVTIDLLERAKQFLGVS